MFETLCFAALKCKGSHHQLLALPDLDRLSPALELLRRGRHPRYPPPRRDCLETGHHPLQQCRQTGTRLKRRTPGVKAEIIKVDLRGFQKLKQGNDAVAIKRKLDFNEI